MRCSGLILALLCATGCGRFGFGNQSDESEEIDADPGPSDPLMGFDDGFEDGIFDSDWLSINAENIDESEADGSLTLIPTGGLGFWTDGGEGPLYFKRVSGDFSITAELEVYSQSNPSMPPSSSASLAGLLARDESSNMRSVEDHVWIAFGSINESMTGAEAKSIDDNVTEIDDYDWAHMRGQLRICRVGSRFKMLTRNGGPWQNPASYERPDLPQELQVGFLMHGGDNDGPDMEARFSEIRFRTPTSIDDCELD